MSIEQIKNQTVNMPISVTIKDKNALHSSYLTFSRNGGLFIPINKSFAMGEEVSLLVNLMIEEPHQKFSVLGKVMWITPQRSQGSRAGGIGVELAGTEGANLRVTIEKILGEGLKSEQSTHTM
jgi:type IV pilus assembly protein PilZ